MLKLTSKRRESTCTYVQVPKVVKKVNEDLDEIVSEGLKTKDDDEDSTLDGSDIATRNSGTRPHPKKDGFSLQRAWCCLTGRRTS